MSRFAFLVVFGIFLPLLRPAPVWARPPRETMVAAFVSPEAINEWSALPGSRDFILQLANPDPQDLRLIGRLKGASRIQIQVECLPGTDTLAGWKSLADQGVELVVTGGGAPTVSEIERLNRIGFPRILFVMGYFPDLQEAARLRNLKTPFSIRFLARQYPRFTDRDALRAMPESASLGFVTDYWPWYVQMDLFNMLPQPKRIHVKDLFPEGKGLEYLLAIQRLEEVTVETDYEPPPGTWDRFQSLNVRWLLRDLFPSAAGLDDFARSAGARPDRRLLRLHNELAPTAEEWRRLSGSPVPVEWAHGAGLR